jgi:hypothetical protein
MDAETIGIATFVLLIVSAIAGMAFRMSQPDPAQAPQATSHLRGNVWFVGVMTMALLVAITFNVRSSFDATARAVHDFGQDVIELDRVLREVGPLGAPARHLLFQFTARTMKDVWPNTSPPLEPGEDQTSKLFNALYAAVSTLHPAEPAQMKAADEAGDAFTEMVHARWRMDERSGDALSPLIVGMLVFWLMLTFTGVGLALPRTTRAICGLSIGALALAGIMFATLDYANPYTGFITVSSEPLHDSLLNIAEAK